MAVLEFFVFDKKMSDLLSVVMKLNELAEKELWDDLLAVWPHYDEASSHLPQINWLDYSAVEVQSMQKKMLEIDFAHKKLMLATQAWRNELQDILHTTVQSRKLSDHYR